MKIRKPALAAATLALAITPALTSVAPAQALPKAAPLAAEVDPASLIQQIIAVLPPEMARIATNVAAGDYSELFVLIQLAFALTPEQLNTIINTLIDIAAAVLGGIDVTIAPTPVPTDTATATPTPTVSGASASFGGGSIVLVRDNGDTQDAKVLWNLKALLDEAGKERSPQVLSNILINVLLSAR